MFRFIRYLLVSIIMLQPLLVAADPLTDLYQVEVIVFAHTNQDRFSSEHWPKFVGKLDTKGAVNLDSIRSNIPDSIDTLESIDALDDAGEQPIAKIVKKSITLVDPKHYLMQHELRSLKANKNVRIIKHLAWNQPLASNVKSTPVYFTAGKDDEVIALLSIKPVKNLFSVHLDMIYTIQPEDRKYDPSVDEIRIVRDVKFKKKEAYYIDHPIVGMIIMVSPVIYSAGAYTPLP